MMDVVAALDSVWFSSLLWAVAVAAGIWIIVPAIGFAVYPRKFEVEIDEDPRVAEARGVDADYDAKFQQFATLGFVPVGKTVEKVRFLTPLHWHWRGDGTRLLVSSDRMTFAGLHRVAGANPLRVNLFTTFTGGEIVNTAAPGVGRSVFKGRDRRIEVPECDVATLVQHHQRNLEDFCKGRPLTVELVTLREMEARLAAFSRRNLPKWKTAWFYALPLMCGVMMADAIARSGLPTAPAWLRPATLCFAAIVFASSRWAVLPGRVPLFVRTACLIVGMNVVPWLFSGLPDWMTADGKQLAALLDRVEAEARADYAPEGIDRVVARGARVCAPIVTRFEVRRPGSKDRRALHDILVALRGADLGDDPRVWFNWCLIKRLGGP